MTFFIDGTYIEHKARQINEAKENSSEWQNMFAALAFQGIATAAAIIGLFPLTVIIIVPHLLEREPGADRKAGTCRLSAPASRNMTAGSVCPRGAYRNMPRPKESSARRMGQSAPSAPLIIRCVAGSITARRGSQRARSGSGSGEDFPLQRALLNHSIAPCNCLRYSQNEISARCITVCHADNSAEIFNGNGKRSDRRNHRSLDEIMSRGDGTWA